ncbi:hypothetical protein IMCC3317_02430 [Kordia antarctica]|uniref:Uncharacterized protein n=1 Tax=Kordia antarctica TaxID=1218801 RepID=A0A7L4ZDM5_9FLAO|nr:hypothetical protein [Kordia antarctica]QHI34898.1 hypothetical protein IMCC3317_02430 [Kordia antarctica]
MKKIVFIFLLIGIIFTGFSQNNNEADNNAFTDYYPIVVKPTFGFLTNNNAKEDILFDAKPTVYYSIYNDMRSVMQNSIEKPSDAIYITFQPHIRMYAEDSKPVKTPSYRFMFGWQRLVKTKSNNFFAWAVESGHYSNGQSGCAFLAGEDDESVACTDFHATITDDTNLSDLLNRNNGNFSTNTTKFSFNFRFNNLNEFDKPYKVHSFTTSWELYHNRFLWLFDFGGFSDFDINIYGRNRFSLGYEFVHAWKPDLRYAFEQKFEIIQGAHPFVEPLRSETTLTLYPFDSNIGIFASYIYGHDNYNYRFVDSGNQISVGISWDWFTPFQIKRAEKIRERSL